MEKEKINSKTSSSSSSTSSTSSNKQLKSNNESITIPITKLETEFKITTTPSLPFISDLDPCAIQPIQEKEIQEQDEEKEKEKINQTTIHQLLKPPEQSFDSIISIEQSHLSESSTTQPNSIPLSQSHSVPPQTINTRNRASSWSIFRSTSLSQIQAPSTPTNLISKLINPSSISPPTSAPISGPSHSKNFKPSHSSTASASFSLSSIASALKRPLSLSTSSAPPDQSSTHSALSSQSPSDSKPNHEGLSPKDADPDPTPSVPPRLIFENTSDETPPVPFDFNAFLDQMKWPQAQPIAKYLRSFLREFTKRANHPNRPTSVAEHIKVVNDFLDFISIKMREIPDGPWDPKNCHDSEFENAIEAMEKLVMNRVWHLTFTPALSTPQPSQTDDLERDTVLSQKLNLFSWMTDRHLDLNLPSDEADGFLEFAKTELLKVNSYKAPRDKMICILNCCKVIFGLIRHIDQKDGGADIFIPILILVVLRAQPKNLISNVQYIQRFRNPDQLQGENGYYLSSLNAAISFIERLEHSVLSNITQSEFEFNVEQAILRLPRSPVAEFPSSSTKDGSTNGGATQGSFTNEGPNQGTSLIPDQISRSWLFTTVPQLAEKAVSKPLNAISKIVDDMASESDESWNNRGRPDLQNYRRASYSNTSFGSPRRAGKEAEEEEEGINQSKIEVNRRGNRRGHRPWSVDSPRINSNLPLSLNHEEHFFDQDLKQIESLKRAEHEAHLQTLASIFPDVDPELREVVLVTHHGLISKAIDSLLEMS